MPLHERVSAHAATLTTSDRALLDVLLQHPQQAVYLSAAEVAGRAGVHQASATKFAQRLGYAGYPDLRRELRADLLASAAERMSRTVEGAGDQGLLESLVAHEITSLSDLPRQVGQDQLDRVAHLLLGARTRYVFGRGNAAVLADLLQRRLRRFGLPTTTLPGSGRDLAEHLVALAPDDVVVLFAFRRPPRFFDAVLQTCADLGVPTVVVTDTLASRSTSAREVLTAARGAAHEFQTLTVPTAITNALVLTVARAAPESTGAALRRLDHLLGRLDD